MTGRADGAWALHAPSVSRKAANRLSTHRRCQRRRCRLRHWGRRRPAGCLPRQLLRQPRLGLPAEPPPCARSRQSPDAPGDACSTVACLALHQRALMQSVPEACVQAQRHPARVPSALQTSYAGGSDGGLGIGCSLPGSSTPVHDKGTACHSLQDIAASTSLDLWCSWSAAGLLQY